METTAETTFQFFFHRRVYWFVPTCLAIIGGCLVGGIGVIGLGEIMAAQTEEARLLRLMALMILAACCVLAIFGLNDFVPEINARRRYRRMTSADKIRF